MREDNRSIHAQRQLVYSTAKTIGLFIGEDDRSIHKWRQEVYSPVKITELTHDNNYFKIIDNRFTSIKIIGYTILYTTYLNMNNSSIEITQ